MSALELLVAAAGCGVTSLVVAAMILITPRGVVDLRAEAITSPRTDVRHAEAPEHAEGVPARP